MKKINEPKVVLIDEDLEFNKKLNKAIMLLREVFPTSEYNTWEINNGVEWGISAKINPNLLKGIEDFDPWIYLDLENYTWEINDECGNNADRDYKSNSPVRTINLKNLNIIKETLREFVLSVILNSIRSEEE